MKNTSIRFRIFFSYSFLLIFAILITLLVRQKIGRDYYKEVVLSSYKRELVYIMNQLETQLDFVEDYQKSISLDPVVMDTLSRNQKAPKEESRYYSMNRTLRNRVTAILGANKYIYQYIFITLDNDFLSFRDEAFPSIKRKYVRIGITRQENLVSKAVRIPYFMALRHKKSENKYLFCRENGKNLSREGGSL